MTPQKAESSNDKVFAIVVGVGFLGLFLMGWSAIMAFNVRPMLENTDAEAPQWMKDQVSFMASSQVTIPLTIAGILMWIPAGVMIAYRRAF
jgi:hypothetical protein